MLCNGRMRINGYYCLFFQTRLKFGAACEVHRHTGTLGAQNGTGPSDPSRPCCRNILTRTADGSLNLDTSAKKRTGEGVSVWAMGKSFVIVKMEKEEDTVAVALKQMRGFLSLHRAGMRTTAAARNQAKHAGFSKISLQSEQVSHTSRSVAFRCSNMQGSLSVKTGVSETAVLNFSASAFLSCRLCWQDVMSQM